MKPPARQRNFEKVVIGEFITGVISDIQYENEHSFMFQGTETIAPGVRFVFVLDGYKFNHYSRWMKFNTGNKSNLFQKYLSKLVEGCQPDCEFDIDILKNMKIKTIWSEKGDFQNLDSIYPNGPKVQATAPVAPKQGTSGQGHEEEPPIDEEQAF